MGTPLDDYRAAPLDHAGWRSPSWLTFAMHCRELHDADSVLDYGGYLLDRLDAAERERDEARKDAERLLSVLEEAVSPGVFAYFEPVNDPSLAGTPIESICQQHGYGAVMHYVEYLWKQRSIRNGLEGSEHTCAACASVRRGWLEQARTAIDAARKEAE